MPLDTALEPDDYTLSSPLAAAAPAGAPLLGLTIVWHPDTARIGEQCVTDGAIGVSRYLPLFQRPGQALAGLGYMGISRDSVRIVRGADGVLELHPPASRMAVEVNGVEIHAPFTVRHGQVAAGVILGLGRAVLLCLHWMRTVPTENALPGLLGVGGAAIALRTLVRQAAATDDTVLLLGETGTGKEVVARAIHACSARSARPLVTVNMAALNDALAGADLFGAVRGAYTGATSPRSGFFGEAHNATLFLDEIGNAPVAIQPMLLRVLETGDYRALGARADLHATARVIAATDQALHAGAFNQALLRRLESFVIHLPPLRARREDIGVLLLHMLGEHPARDAFFAALAARFALYDWPGNVRQLRHVARRCLLALQAGEQPDFDSLLDEHPAPAPPPASAPAPGAEQPLAVASAPRKKLADISAADVLQALDMHGWTIQGAARELGISRPSMYRLIRAHPHIRAAAAIPDAEIAAALAATGNAPGPAAALLKTPAEALRRQLRTLGLG